MKYSCWFVTDSKFLYSSELLEPVNARAKELVTKMSIALPYPLIYKVTTKSSREIVSMVALCHADGVDANAVVRAV